MPWPRGVPHHRTLSDRDLAALAAAILSGRASAAELAQQLGKPYFTVAQALRKLRREGGWHTRLTWTTCTECARPLCHGPQRRAAHAGCERARAARYSRERRQEQPGQSTPYVRAWRERNPARLAVMRASEKVAQRNRYYQLPEPVRETGLGRVHAIDRRDFEATLELAEQRGQRWAGPRRPVPA